MKQSLKYGILFVFVLLLHSITSEATEGLCTPGVSRQETCYLSQARPIRNAIERFYHLYSALPCDMEHADLSHKSADKSFLRLSTRQCAFRGIIPPVRNNSFNLYTHTPADPITEYIYGQRKIVI